MSNSILRLYCAFLLLSFGGSSAFAQNFTVSPSNEVDVLQGCGGFQGFMYDSGATIIVRNQIDSTLHLKVSVDDTDFVSSLSDTVLWTRNDVGIFSIRYAGFDDSASATLTVTDGITTTKIPVKGRREFRATSDGLTCGIDFGVLNPGQTRCEPFTFFNTSSGWVIIDTVYSEWGNSSISSVPKLPLLLLAGESVIVGRFCLTGADTASYDDIVIGYSMNSQQNWVKPHLKTSIPYDPWAAKPCLTATMDSTLFGPVIVGGSVTANITIANNRLDTITIGSAQFTGDAAEFSVGVPLPVYVMPHTSQSIPVVFSTHPQDSLLKSRYIAQLQLVRNASSCTIPSFTLPAVTLAPTDTTVAQQLFPNQTQTLAMLGGSQTITRTFYFTNNSGTKVKVDAVTLANTSSFSITNISPGATPFTLNNGDKMSVTISLNTTSNQVYYDELIITTEQGVQSLHVPIQGLRAASASVPIAQVSSDVSLSIVPNPAMNDVTVSANGINVSVGIFDLLGNPMATASVPSGSWRWDGTANGARVPSGNYVVRVSGIGMDGKAFVNSKMLEMR